MFLFLFHRYSFLFFPSFLPCASCLLWIPFSVSFLDSLSFIRSVQGFLQTPDCWLFVHMKEWDVPGAWSLYAHGRMSSGGPHLRKMWQWVWPLRWVLLHPGIFRPFLAGHMRMSRKPVSVCSCIGSKPSGRCEVGVVHSIGGPHSPPPCSFLCRAPSIQHLSPCDLTLSPFPVIPLLWPVEKLLTWNAGWSGLVWIILRGLSQEISV